MIPSRLLRSFEQKEPREEGIHKKEKTRHEMRDATDFEDKEG